MNTSSKLGVITLIAIGMMFIPGITNNNNGFTSVTAQSQSATVQQQSQPPSSISPQNNTNNPQIGQVFTFNEKSKPVNDPQKCAALASVVNSCVKNVVYFSVN